MDLRELTNRHGRHPVIALGGRLRSGKDTVADYLVEKYSFVKIGMSDPLQDALLTLNPWVDLNLRTRVQRYADYVAETGYTEAKKHPEVRRLLKVLGTEVGREMISTSVWADIASRRIQELRRNSPVAVTGMRFGNELGMAGDLGALTVWVERPGVPSDDHASETSVSEEDFDITLLNDGTLEDLYKRVDRLGSANWMTAPLGTPWP